uniref:Uncharacterized protein n=1 Tax=Glossina morsitans morsitans TaxID=37546 RepID=A0A1B0FQ40_GLOMM
MAIGDVDFDGVECLALVTGDEIVPTFDNPSLINLDECELLEQVTIGENTLLCFSGVKSGEGCTIVIHVTTHHILDEAEPSLRDALRVTTVKYSHTT